MITERKPYSSDLSNPEWEILELLLPAEKPGGRHRKYDLREIINGIQYILRSGCSWRLMPHDLPHWQSVYYYFSVWKRDGTWLRIHDHLHKEVREKMGRDSEPSAAIIDSQSVKTTEKGGFMDTMERKS
jgi:putative transposase